MEATPINEIVKVKKEKKKKTKEGFDVDLPKGWLLQENCIDLEKAIKINEYYFEAKYMKMDVTIREILFDKENFSIIEKELKDEIDILISLYDNNITKFIGYCKKEDRILFVYEYCKGGDLKTALKNYNFSIYHRLKFSNDIFQALLKLGSGNKKIVHRNITSSNILIAQYKNKLEIILKLTNFAKARILLKGSDEKKEEKTKIDLQPENLKNKNISLKSDIYCFGILLWEIFSNKNPYEHFNLTYDELEKKLRDSDNILTNTDNYIVGTPQEIKNIIKNCICEEKNRTNLEQLQDDFHLINQKIVSDDFYKTIIDYEKLYGHEVIPTNSKNFLSNMMKENKFLDYPIKSEFLTKINKSSSKICELHTINYENKDTTIKVIPLEEFKLDFHRNIIPMVFLKHENIVSFKGYSKQENKIFFLMDCDYKIKDISSLYNKNVLNFKQKVKICIDIAHGLQYLSKLEYPIIIWGLNSNQIVIDKEIIKDDMNFTAKIHDFMFSTVCENVEKLKIIKSKLSNENYILPKITRKGEINPLRAGLYSFCMLISEIFIEDKNFLRNKIIDDDCDNYDDYIYFHPKLPGKIVDIFYDFEIKTFEMIASELEKCLSE